MGELHRKGRLRTTEPIRNQFGDAPLFAFSQSNPDGEGKGDVPALLRRVADTIEERDVEVSGIGFESIPTADEDVVTLTVYYYLKDRPSLEVRKHLAHR